MARGGERKTPGNGKEAVAKEGKEKRKRLLGELGRKIRWK